MTNVIEIEIFDDPSVAPKYTEEWGYLKIEKALVVCNGTVEGNPTVDLQFVDKQGNKYVAMATGGILESVVKVLQAKRGA